MPNADPYDIEIERSRLREIRSRLPEAARPLGGALPKLVSLTLAESAYTSFTYTLAIAYSEVEAFTMTEVRRRVQDTSLIQDGMTMSLTTWQQAEDAGKLRAT